MHTDVERNLSSAANLQSLLDGGQNSIETSRAALQEELAAKRPLVSPKVILGTLRLADTLTFMAVSLAIYALYVAQFTTGKLFTHLPVILAGGVTLPVLFQMAGLYTLQSVMNVVGNVARMYFALLALFSGIFALVFFTQAGDSLSRLWLGCWMIGSMGILTWLRFAAAGLVRRWNSNGQLNRRTLLVGGGEPAAELIGALEGSGDTDLSIVGVFDDRGDGRSPRTVAGLPKLGTIAELVDFVREARVDLLVVTLPLTAETRLLEILRQLWVLPVDIRLSAYTQKLRYRPRAYSYIGNIPFLDVFDKPLSDWDGIIKSFEDRLIAGLAILALSPVMALVALAIKLDSRGPVLFRQNRYGFNNELIGVYKFRSMYADKCDADARKLVTKGDPRVTRVGNFIRRTSLDELPQLFNVLKGELSLVGPRPHPTQAKADNSLYTDVVDGYFARHRVKPGITGWAQVNGWRGETDTHEKIQRRVEHDLYYIENWSVLLDLYILFKTPFVLVDSENTY